jgi:MOSC domain-containing protein YiiM
MEEKQAPVVVGIHIAPAAQKPMVSLPEVHAVPGRGLEGDRYFAGGGTFTESGRGGGTEVTLIELEALDRLRTDYGIDLRPQETRRNIATQGITLDELIGREFRIGEVRMRGLSSCEPCAHLVELAGKQVLRGLVHRGGLRAQIITDGTIHVGDSIVPSTMEGTMELL